MERREIKIREIQRHKVKSWRKPWFPAKKYILEDCFYQFLKFTMDLLGIVSGQSFPTA